MGKIEFISTIDGLDKIEDLKPKPSKSFLPDWWKNMPSGRTVKNCPSFPDYFSQGFIIPMWSDTVIAYDKTNDVKIAKVSHLVYPWQEHFDFQFLDHVNASFLSNDASFVFKAVCPWRIITPPGWSVLQLPLFYHFNNDFSVLPGIIDTDIHHEINQQVLYHGNGKQVKIDRGQPFVLYIPFERKKIEYVVRSQNKKDIKKFNISALNVFTKFTGGYRTAQRNRDKNG